MTSIIVHATKIDSKKVQFECPFCFTSYKNDGQPKKNSKRLTHTHGSENDTTDRILYRSSHCDVLRYRGEFQIIVDDNTKRS